MQEPKRLYNLRYYARRRGYYLSKKGKVATVPEANRSKKIESRLKSFGYCIQLNIFQYE